MPVPQDLIDKMQSDIAAGHSPDDIVSSIADGKLYPDVATKVRTDLENGYSYQDIFKGITSAPIQPPTPSLWERVKNLMANTVVPPDVKAVVDTAGYPPEMAPVPQNVLPSPQPSPAGGEGVRPSSALELIQQMKGTPLAGTVSDIATAPTAMINRESEAAQFLPAAAEGGAATATGAALFIPSVVAGASRVGWGKVLGQDDAWQHGLQLGNEIMAQGYQPKTEAGQQAASIATMPFEAYNSVVDKAIPDSWSPEAKAAAKLASWGAILLGPAALKMGKDAVISKVADMSHIDTGLPSEAEFARTFPEYKADMLRPRGAGTGEGQGLPEQRFLPPPTTAPEQAPIIRARKESALPAPETTSGLPTPEPAAKGALEQGAAAGPSYAGPERRMDTNLRAKWADMTPEEQYQSAHTDYLTGLKNRRAWDEDGAPQHVGVIDLDGFGQINKDFSQEVGDKFLQAVAAEVDISGAHDWTYRPNEGGDELMVRGNTPEEVQARIAHLDNALQSVIIQAENKDGTTYILENPRFSYGTGKDYSEAAQSLAANKTARELSGQRVKGSYPEGMVVQPEADWQARAGRNLESAAQAEPAGGQTAVAEKPGGAGLEGPDQGGRVVQAGSNAVAPGQDRPGITPHPEQNLFEEAANYMTGRVRNDYHDQFMSARPAGWSYNAGGAFLSRVTSGEITPKTIAQKRFVDAAISGMRDMKAHASDYEKLPPVEAIPHNVGEPAPTEPVTVSKPLREMKGTWAQEIAKMAKRNQTAKGVSAAYEMLQKKNRTMAEPAKEPWTRINETREPWQITRDHWANIKDSSISLPDHKDVVQKAIDEGKPVPLEVLKQYPDLQPTELHGFGSAIFQPLFKGSRDLASKALVKSFDAVGQRIPPEWKEEVLDAAFGVPNFIVERHPARGPLYKENLKRAADRHRDNTFVFKPDAETNYPGVEPVLKLGKDDVKALSNILVRGDRDKARYTPEQLKEKFKANNQVVESYDAARQMVERLQGIIISKTKDIALAPYETVPSLYDKLGRMANDLIETPDPKERDRYMANMVHDVARQSDADAQKAMHRVAKYIDQIHEYIKIFDDNPGYIPRVREDGGFKVTVSRRTEPGAENPYEEVFMQTAPTYAKAKALKAQVMAKPEEFFPENFNKNSKYRYDVAENKKLSEDVYSDIGGMAAREELLRKAIDKAEQRGDIKVGDVEAISDAIMSAVQEEVAKRGAGRAFIGRHDTLIEGYKTADLDKVLISHVTGMVGWLNKGLYGVRGLREIGALRDPADMRWAQQYFKHSLKNAGALDRGIATARGAASMWYLGLNLKQALLHSFKQFTSAWPELSRYTGNPGVQLMSADKDVWSGHLSAFDKKVLNEGIDSGLTDAQYTRQISGAADRSPTRGFSKAVDFSMKPLRFVEEEMNRKPAYLAAMRLYTGAKNANGKYYGLNKNGKPYNMSYAQAMDKADEFVRAAHFQITKENEPEMVSRMGAVGHGLYAFQSFIANRLNWIFNRAAQGEMGALGRAVLAQWVLGGMMAATVPFMDDIWDPLLMKMFGFSVKHELRKLIRGALAKTGNTPDVNTTLEDIIMTGIPSAAGVDMHKSVAHGAPLPIALFLDPNKTGGEKMGGVLFGLGEKGARAIGAAAKGEWYRAGEQATPGAISSAMSAYRLYNEGMTTTHGKPITDETGKQLKATGTEAVEKAAGFQPTRISKLQEERQYEQELKQNWNDDRQTLLDRYRMSRGDATKRAEVQKEIQDFNAKLRSDKEASLVVEPINARSMIGAITEKQGIRQFKERKFMQEMTR